MRRPLPLVLLFAASVACANKPTDASANDDAGEAQAKAETKTDAETTPEAEPGQPNAEPNAEPAGHEAPMPTAKAEVGQAAPAFSLTDLDGKAHSLAQYKGKLVVLEWFNPECPFVNYAHSEGPLVDLAKKQGDAGVVWLAINSGGPGRQGNGAAANRAGVEKFGMTNPVLLDEDGAIGRAYGAEKTPHMFLVDDKGVLRYAGGIDNAPMGEVDGDAEKRDHLVEALVDVRAGKDVRVTTAPSWGCTVKYAS